MIAIKDQADAIIAEACRLFNFAPKDILGDNRYKHMVACRYAIYDAMKHVGATQQQIAKWMCKNHSSVHHGLRVVGDRLAEDTSYRAASERLREYAERVTHYVEV